MRQLAFVLGTLLPLQAAAAVFTADLQPYGVCTASGCGEPIFDGGILAETWGQADIAFAILPPLRTAPVEAATARPGLLDARDALGAFRRSVAEVRPNTVYVGFTGPLDAAYGMAYRNAPETRLYPFAIIESGLPPRLAGLVTAHEVGHVLGATHVTGPSGDNLMRLGLPPRAYTDPGFVPPILAETRNAVRSSPVLAAVTIPAPPSFALGLSVLVLAMLRARSARTRDRRRAGRDVCVIP